MPRERDTGACHGSVPLFLRSPFALILIISRVRLQDFAEKSDLWVVNRSPLVNVFSIKISGLVTRGARRRALAGGERATGACHFS